MKNLLVAKQCKCVISVCVCVCVYIYVLTQLIQPSWGTCDFHPYFTNDKTERQG